MTHPTEWSVSRRVVSTGNARPPDPRYPARAIEDAVAHSLLLAQTWPHWDGTPMAVQDRVYTPHKAIRRLSDHLVDHLAELEARLAGETPMPDHWHASMITTAADLVPFTHADLDEARSRLSRLAQIWSIRLRGLTDEQLDRADHDAWTLRTVAMHVASTFYADSVGNLAPSQAP